MGKILSTFLALLLLLSGCANAQNPQFVSTATHQEFLENGVVTGTSDYYASLNDQGLVIGVKDYTDGVLTFCCTYLYDEFGNMVRITEEKDGNTIVTELNNTLDDQGRILRQENRTNGVLTSLREITYNRHGQEATHHVTAWHIDGELDGSSDYTMAYNWKGQLTRQVHLRDSGEKYVWEYQDGLCVRETAYEAQTHAVTYYWEYTYDEKDRCIRETRYGANGEQEMYRENVYDDDARTMTSTPYHSNTTLHETYDVYHYDEYGNEILRERFEDGEVYWRICTTWEPLKTAQQKGDDP